MSVAFTKEDSAETAAETMLPDRPIPDGPNLVTAAGLAALERQLAEARAAYDAAMLVDDVNERRRQAANPFGICAISPSAFGPRNSCLLPRRTPSWCSGPR